MTSSATETFQRGVQSLQTWLDFLDSEESKLQAQLAKMQGNGKAIPEIDADLPPLAEVDESDVAEDTDATDDDSWL